MADAATKPRRRRPAYLRKKSFTEALKEKYCVDPPDSMKSGGFVVQIVYHGRPKSNGSDAELAHLRNVVSLRVDILFLIVQLVWAGYNNHFPVLTPKPINF